MRFMLGDYGIKSECLTLRKIGDVDYYLKSRDIDVENIICTVPGILPELINKYDKDNEYSQIVNGYNENTCVYQIISDAVNAMDIDNCTVYDDETQDKKEHKTKEGRWEGVKAGGKTDAMMVLEKYSDVLDKMTEENQLLTDVIRENKLCLKVQEKREEKRRLINPV